MEEKPNHVGMSNPEAIRLRRHQPFVGGPLLNPEPLVAKAGQQGRAPVDEGTADLMLDLGSFRELVTTEPELDRPGLAKIGITPEMIKAGVAEYLSYGSDDLAGTPAHEIVIGILIAALEFAPSSHPSG